MTDKKKIGDAGADSGGNISHARKEYLRSKPDSKPRNNLDDLAGD